MPVAKETTNIQYTERKERIEARRQRIKAQQKKLAQNEEKTQEETEHIEQGPQQISASKVSFSAVFQKGMEKISEIEIESQSQEAIRRTELENRMIELVKRKEEEKLESEKAGENIYNSWSSIKTHTVPQDLLQAIQDQKKLCDSILTSKVSFIKELEEEIKNKEEEFGKSLTKHGEDIGIFEQLLNDISKKDLLIKNTREQLKKICETADKELEESEKAFISDREKLKVEQTEEISSFMEERRLKEIKYLDIKMERIDGARKQLEELRTIKAEEYNELKIKLEGEIQILEQALQGMKAIYQLNSEKLEFNLRMLDERESEHEQLIHQQKKKINRLQDLLSTVKAKYAKSDKKFKHKNLELTEEYRRVTEQYRDLQNKFKHFVERDKKKYQEIKEMNKERIQVLIQKLLEADKVISEQQLGLNWFPPQADLFEKKVPLTLMQNLSSVKPERDSLTLNPTARQVFAMIVDEAGFLIEEKVNRIVANIDTDQRNQIKIESIMKALGVETLENAEILLGYFIEDEEDQTLIHPNQVLDALKQFVLDFQAKKREEQVGSLSLAEELEKSEKNEKLQEKEFWERLGNVIDTQHSEVWEILERELLKYNQLLSDRVKLLQETESIKKQNDQLKQLLNTYISSPTNDDLVLPPITLG